MTLMEIVMELRKEGHIVEFSKRKDGGILIKAIDGIRYPTGASGNAVAREMVGAKISEARIKQLKSITKERVKRIKLPDAVEEEFKRVKKKWNKAFRAKGGKPHPAGRFTKTRIDYAIKNYGVDEALRRIKEAERYAEGIAYSKNVEHLVEMIIDAAIKMGNNQDLLSLAEDIRANMYAIRDEWIFPAYKELYHINSGEDPKTVAKNVRMILRL